MNVNSAGSPSVIASGAVKDTTGRLSDTSVVSAVAVGAKTVMAIATIASRAPNLVAWKNIANLL
ncbi:MAG: hypothetical protein OXC55_01555 [Chloroflexi bacterium]|nr:hypothetical protein [Chloroflexota bacterium]